MVCNVNSRAFTLLIILDRDARRLIKRQKLSHSRPDTLHEVRALNAESHHGAASQHAVKTGRRKLDESRPLRRNANDDGKSCETTVSGTIGKVKGTVGRSRLRPMVGMVGVGSKVNLTEVRTEFISPFLSWAET